MNKFPRIDWRFTSLGLLLLVLLLRYFMSFNPTFTELVYSRGLFAIFRWIFDFTLGLSPVPILYVAIFVLLGWGIWRIIKKRDKSIEKRPFRNKLGSFLLSLSAIISLIITSFLLLWGLNYHRVPVERQFELDQFEVTESHIKTEAILATEQLIEARKQIANVTRVPLDQTFLPADLENTMRPLLKSVLQDVGYPIPGRVRCRKIYPKGWMMRLGAIGIYIPFIGEGHVDGGVHPIARPFTMVHEMSHAYGFGDEGTANFLAYLSTESSEDPFVRYAGRMSYWRYAVGQLYSVDQSAFEELIAQLPEDVKGDWQEIRKTHAQYPAFFPILFNKIYDRFLKSQGVKEGTRSYSRVVKLVISWRQTQQ